MSAHPGRGIVLAGFALWAVSVLYVIGCLVTPSLVGASGCELVPGSSVFGEPGRSWLPPGTTCTYDLDDPGLPPLVTGPSALRLVVVGAALVGLPVLVHLRRLLTRAAPASIPA